MKILLIFLLLLLNSKASNVIDLNLMFFGHNLRDFITINSQNVGTHFSLMPLKYHNRLRKNFIFIHGWQPSHDSRTMNATIGAYLDNRRIQYNIIYLDWSSKAFSLDYLEVVTQLRPVTKAAVELLSQIHERGFDMTQTHICGFSFGAIIAGGIGRYFKFEKGLELPRITGLDPGEFYNSMSKVFAKNQILKLNSDAAQFVDIIHTNANGLGDGIESLGHVDFWPNSGRDQPGCETYSSAAFKEALHSWDDMTEHLGCSHTRAWEYYAESVGRPPSSPAFIANRCSTVVTAKVFFALRCTLTAHVSMGYYADVTTTNRNDFVTVNYFVNTRNTSLYSLN